MLKISPVLALVIMGIFTTLSASTHYSIASSEVRLESAQSHLSGNPNQIAFYSKGLVCSSCAIGLRIHIKKLDGIDRNKLDDGIHLDAKNQLLIVAFEQGFVPNILKIIRAIDKAGYESTHYYRIIGEVVQINTLKEEN